MKIKTWEEFKKLEHGTKIRGRMFEKEFDEGAVSIDEDDQRFICQNVSEGLDADDKLEYKYSRLVNGTENFNLETIEDEEQEDKPRTMRGEYEIKNLEAMKGWQIQLRIMLGNTLESYNVFLRRGNSYGFVQFTNTIENLNQQIETMTQLLKQQYNENEDNN